MRIFIGVFLLPGLISCGGEKAPPQEMTGADRGQVQAEILDWSDQWLTAATGLDAQGVAGLMDQADAHFIMAGTYNPTWAAFHGSIQNQFLGLAEWQADWGMRRIDVLGADVALFVGETIGRIRSADGSEAGSRSVFSFVIRKKEGVWTGLFGQMGRG